MKKVEFTYEAVIKALRERGLQELLGDDENEKIKVKQKNRNIKIDGLIETDQDEMEP